MNPRGGMSVVELTIAAALLLLIAAISVPALQQNVRKRQAAVCAQNLEVLGNACRRQFQDHGAPVKFEDLVPDYLDAVPACPAGGVYSWSGGTDAPCWCSVHGRALEPAPESSP